MGLLTPLAIRIGAQPWMPKLLPQVVWVDKSLQRVSGGRVTVLDLAGLPNLMLTVRGRKSGIARSTPLLCVPRGHVLLVAGSYFGGPTEPMWVKNVEANPDVTVRFDGVESSRRARLLEGEERALAWGHLLRTWPNFALYEQRTDRTIKVFELALRPAPTAP
jgi:deazaflavin-dependent oxidoreductase (nitroreductase family)